jgi:predicted nucleic acid-binding protein
MPLVYADTSALFAFFHPEDEFAEILTVAVHKASPDFVYWAFLRFELRHNLRQARVDSAGETAWRALRAAERTQARLRWQADLKTESILEAAEDLSAELALESLAGSSDFIHIAAARRLHLLSGIEQFWTCDEQQCKAAKAAGLKVRLFRISR